MITICQHIASNRTAELKLAILEKLGEVGIEQQVYTLYRMQRTFSEEEKATYAGMLFATSAQALKDLTRRPSHGSHPYEIQRKLFELTKYNIISFVEIAQHFPAVQRNLFYTEARRRILALPPGYHRVDTMITVASHMNGSLDSNIVSECYKEVHTAPVANNRLHFLSRIVPLMPPELARTAIAEAFQAAEAQAIETESERTEHWAKLATHLTVKNKKEFFAPTLNRILTCKATYGLPPSEEMLALADENQRIVICKRLLNQMKKMEPGVATLFSLACFIPRIPEAIRQEAVDLLVAFSTKVTARKDAIFLTDLSLAVHALPKENRTAVILQIFARINQIVDAYQRASILTRLIPFSSGTLQREIIEEAIRTTKMIIKEEPRVRMLAQLSEELPCEEAALLLSEAKTTAEALGDSSVRQRLLAELKSRPRRKDNNEKTPPHSDAKEHSLILREVESELKKCSEMARKETIYKLVALIPKFAAIGGDDLLLAIAKDIRETASWWHSDQYEDHKF